MKLVLLAAMLFSCDSLSRLSQKSNATEATPRVSTVVKQNVALERRREAEPVSYRIYLVDSPDEEIEDGTGAMRRASKIVAIDLDAAHFPPRALDPVLHIGELQLQKYTYLPDGHLRFSLSAPEKLREGDALYVQYGPAVESRVLLTPNYSGLEKSAR